MEPRLTLKRQKADRPLTPAATLPIARVLVDTGVGHLDEPYDYLVLAAQDAQALPGVRVRIRFGRKLVDGWLIERRATSDFTGKLSPLHAVVSPEVLLTPPLLRLCQEVAIRQAGAVLDVIRAAIPRRHAKVELEPSPPHTPRWDRTELPDRYPLLKTFLSHHAARAVWTLAPGGHHFEEMAHVVQKVAATGKGVLVILPDERDVTAFARNFPSQDGIAILRADLSPAERYRRYLRVSRGVDRIAIGTRSASFAPIKDLGLLMVWDDGDASHFEPHAPTWNSLDVLALRSHLERTPLLIAGFTVSLEAQKLMSTNWAHLIGHQIRPRVVVSDEEFARVSSKTWKLVKEASALGPVLITVSRAGYLPTLQCRKCASPALCQCGGRIEQKLNQTPSCHLCGALHQNYACRACGGSGYRAPVRGVERTAEELGRAFPSTIVRHSSGEKPIASVPDKPMIVLSTQGVEPLALNGYVAVVILDAQSLLMHSDLRAEEEARRRWFNSASLVRPDGTVLLSGDASHPAVQSLTRWAPQSAAERELSEREELHFPPAWHAAVVESSTNDPELLEALREIGEVLGPLALEQGWRFVVRAPSPIAVQMKKLSLSRALRRQPVKVRINPFTL